MQEVFNFPNVAPRNQYLDSRAITLVTGSSRKISVRLQQGTTSQATQTEPLWHEPGWGDSGSHTFPKMKSRLHGKPGKNKGFAKWENEKPSVEPNLDTVASTAHVLKQNGTDDLLERQDMEVSYVIVKPWLCIPPNLQYCFSSKFHRLRTTLTKKICYRSWGALFVLNAEFITFIFNM